ncbi:hypothetical protein FA048_12425 [Pedobacter polaris]|uniref:Uncharacterized protein n=1 Tax=Pedobacter polaris TaxID=2571273 RepID=A0A4U1CJZ8_9SPHI|nr:hypothetical protein [Pedobacter polaris]TKC07964.1 hypothetical protein FA048_12425 [Pedobacter polaris]
MKKSLLIVIILSFFGLIASAKSNYKSPTLNLDTLKKGKNYNLFSKSSNIASVSFSKSKKSKENLVYIRFGFPTPIPTSNAINGTVLQGNRRYTEDGSVPVFDKIDIIKGKYLDVKLSKDTNMRNLFTLSGLEFPLHLKLYSGKESVDLEVNEAGEWNIGIELKNN